MTSIQIDRLDGLTSSVAYKGPCRVATTGNILLYNLQTVDGVALVSGDRVLVKDQTSGSENGIYRVDTGPWQRVRDFNKTRDVVRGTRVVVNEGTANAGLEWEVVTDNPINVGTTSIQWRIVAGSAGSGGVLVFSTKAQMDAYLTADANTVAYVIADSTSSNNGIYQKQGASGSGSWLKIGDQAGSVIRLLNSGAGTANAIVAATSQSIPGNAYRAIFLLNITAANTGNVTLSVNGQSAAQVLDNLGSELAADYLKPGMILAIAWTGSAYRTITDAASLMASIAAERLARIAADDAERAARIAGDQNLQAQIDGINSELDEFGSMVARAEAAADSAENSAIVAQDLVEAATSGFIGFQDGLGYDWGWISDETTYFDQDWGSIAA